MIQQLISTSAPRCLNGNAGFGIVAQTSGMAPNMSLTANALSGYFHCFPAGDARNPVVFLHAIRHLGGTTPHFISRVSDSGNDYSGRTNRFAHHWIIEQSDIPALACGPAALALQDIFLPKWDEASQELPFRNPFVRNPVVTPISDADKICALWRSTIGDAGWAGVVAEHLESGHPVSILYSVAQQNLPLHLIGEILALLPEQRRWQTTYSTFFMFL